MWPPWSNSPTRSSNNRSRTFSCSSFKDIQSLIKETPLNPSCHSRTLSIFHRVRISNSVLRALSRPSPSPAWSPPPHPHGSDGSIIVYFTSLRIVRKTFEDCRTLRSILRGFRVPIDERDLSMDDGFREELQRILGKGRKPVLPSVLIAGRFIGGVEEVSRMNETGELKRLIGDTGLPVVAMGSGLCGACGGMRFVVCEECRGSHKVYSDKSGFRSCTACNISGLIRCASCSAGRVAGTELVVKKTRD